MKTNDQKASEMKLSKREKEIVDKLNDGYIFNTGVDNGYGRAFCSLVRRDKDDEPVQIALFWRMVNKDILMQRLSSPFDFILTSDYRLRRI